MKQCFKCNKYKPKDSYYAMKASKDGLQPLCKKCDRSRRAANRYGISFEEAAKLYEIDNCEICKKSMSHTNGTEKKCIDHCHETGAIRGVLCYNCNNMLGIVEVIGVDPFINYLNENKND